MRRRGALLVVVAVAGCWSSGVRDPRVVALYGSEREAGIIARPSSVTVERIRTQPPDEARDFQPAPEPEVLSSIDLDAAMREELATLLTDGESYDFLGSAKCLPRPGVRLRLRRMLFTVEIELCFRCGTMTIHGPDRSGGVQFVSQRFLPLMRRLFPTDSAFD